MSKELPNDLKEAGLETIGEAVGRTLELTWHRPNPPHDELHTWYLRVIGVLAEVEDSSAGERVQGRAGYVKFFVQAPLSETVPEFRASGQDDYWAIQVAFASWHECCADGSGAWSLVFRHLDRASSSNVSAFGGYTARFLP